jgi:tungstate transport system substrate-binding protein
MPFWVLLAVAGALVPACRKGAPQRIVLATTTSVRDCGLLDELIPAFEKETGIPVAPIAVGSGEALRMGRDGNADVLLVHDPAGEEQLAQDGFVANDTEIMRSRFVVVGPAADPAGIRGMTGAAEVFAKLGAARATFVSRGDDSGTHRLERKLWKAANVGPDGTPWYVSVGSGMMQTLRVANEKQGYTLADTATWLKAKSTLDLVVLVDSAAPEWANIYSVLLLSPEKFPAINHDGARRFRDFLVSGAGRRIIEDFGKRQYGSPVFQVP